MYLLLRTRDEESQPKDGMVAVLGGGDVVGMKNNLIDQSALNSAKHKGQFT